MRAHRPFPPPPLNRVKEWHNLSQHKVCGKSADVPQDTVDSWKECLGSIFSGYEVQDIWNVDETGCFYCALPDKSLSEKAKKCKEDKKVQRAVDCCSFSLYYRGKEKTGCNWKVCLRYLRNINKDDMPCQYLNQDKAWMSSDNLNKLLSQLNSSFKAQKQSILLFLNSAGYHP